MDFSDMMNRELYDYIDGLREWDYDALKELVRRLDIEWEAYDTMEEVFYACAQVMGVEE